MHILCGTVHIVLTSIYMQCLPWHFTRGCAICINTTRSPTQLCLFVPTQSKNSRYSVTYLYSTSWRKKRCLYFSNFVRNIYIWGHIKWKSKPCIWPIFCIWGTGLLVFSYKAVVAEWLRRWTLNPMGYARAGSNPADCDIIIFKVLFIL
jgi:hypothetical protein